MKYQDLKKFAELLSEKNNRLEHHLLSENKLNRQLSKEKEALEQQLSAAQRTPPQKISVSLCSMEDFYRIYDFPTLYDRPITAIKMIRSLTGLGLKEAKDLYEKELAPYFESLELDKDGVDSLETFAEKRKKGTPCSPDEEKPTQYIPKDQATLGDILRSALRNSDG